MKRGTFKYYLGTYLMVFVFVLIMMIIAHVQKTYLVSANLVSSGAWAKTFHLFLYKDFEIVLGNYLLDILALVAFPLLFAGVFFAIDKATGAMKSKKKRNEEAERLAYEKFVDDIGSDLNKVKTFNVEDFRHFRSNEKFQDCLRKLFDIYRDGESDNTNYGLVLRKFDKGTVERNAIEYLITFTKRKAEVDKDKIEADRAERQAEALKEKERLEQKEKRKKGGK